jgi:hypothetical protein
MTIEQAIVEKLRTLPPDKQQEALEFVEALQIKEHHSQVRQWESGTSALEAARRVMGVVGDAPPDLSTNPKYMEGFGES